MPQLVRIQNLKKNVAVFLHVSSTILNHSQSALHVTDDSRIKILYDSKSLETFRRWSFSGNSTLKSDDPPQISL